VFPTRISRTAYNSTYWFLLTAIKEFSNKENPALLKAVTGVKKAVQARVMFLVSMGSVKGEIDHEMPNVKMPIP
jgi:bisphosphoglycerate-independent phosphoglycerate mutase (AlkP superfamily)